MQGYMMSGLALSNEEMSQSTTLHYFVKLVWDFHLELRIAIVY